MPLSQTILTENEHNSQGEMRQVPSSQCYVVMGDIGSIEYQLPLIQSATPLPGANCQQGSSVE